MAGNWSFLRVLLVSSAYRRPSYLSCLSKKGNRKKDTLCRAASLRRSIDLRPTELGKTRAHDIREAGADIRSCDDPTHPVPG